MRIRINLDSKFQLKLTNFIFRPKGEMQLKMENVSNTIEFCIFTLVDVADFRLN